MDAMQALLQRRSIRQFKDQGVNEQDLYEILRAAMYAPSALDERPWTFVVVRDRSRLRRWAGDLEGLEMLESAPVAVLVCGDLDREQLPGYWVQDCSACTQNLLLAAHAAGLGAVWIAVDFPERAEPIGRELELPASIKPFALVALGKPDERPAADERYEAARVHYELWGRHEA